MVENKGYVSREEYDAVLRRIDELTAENTYLRKREKDLEGLVSHLKARNKQTTREPNSYFEEARKIADVAIEPIAIIGNVPEENKYYVVLYVNRAFTRDLGWDLDDINGEEYTSFLQGERENILESLKGEKNSGIKLKIKDRKGKYRARIIRKVDIPYVTPDGKMQAVTIVYVRHPGFFTKKGVETIDALRKGHDLEELEAEQAREKAEIEKKIQDAEKEARKIIEESSKQNEAYKARQL